MTRAMAFFALVWHLRREQKNQKFAEVRSRYPQLFSDSSLTEKLIDRELERAERLCKDKFWEHFTPEDFEREFDEKDRQ